LSSSNEELKIDSYTLESSTEVKATVEKIKLLAGKRSLIHLVSFIHNTVLVQNLKRELEKELPNSKLVLLKHGDKSKTVVTLFQLPHELTDENDISDEVLKELSVDNSKKHSSIQGYRNQLLKRYFTDHLTDLPNLYQLRKDLELNEEYGLILVKIDNFQMINNFYGFVVGDYVIEFVGNYLKEHLKEYDVYRLSGSEFGLTVKHRLGFYELKRTLNALYQSIKSIELIYQGNRIFIDFSMASSSNNDHSNIFSKVSMALIYAKNRGIPFWIYEDRMNFENEYARNLELSLVVRDAIENSRVIPYFQAIVDNTTGNISKYECLARLIDKNEKILSPVLFIPIAKNIKIYNQVTKSIITKSFEVFENNNYEFNINLSIEDIMSNEIFEFILNKLKSSQAASRVTFELLESEAIKDFKKVERFINEVKRYNAKIAIDDFGSGYSNFFYLTKMQPDYIKIDGSLIENIDVDNASMIVVETIVDFAKKLGIKTVAECVHSSIVMDKVKAMGIDFSQGFYIDEPSIKVKE
jgi:diguanylate cyclase (GGDEF)-like protein